MVEKLSIGLFEKQTSIDVPEAALGVNDFIDVIEPSTYDISPDSAVDNRGGGKFDNYQRTIGKTEVELSHKFALYSMGSGVDPDLVRVAECAGMQRIVDENYIKLKPRSEIIDAGTFWGYKGGPGTNKSLLMKFGNIMYDMVIDLEAAKKAMITFNGKGRLVALPVRATQPDIESQKERVVSPPVMGATVIINGVTYKFLKAQISFNQSVENNVDATNTYGGGDTEITDRNIEFTATVYKKPDNAQIPHNNLYNGVSGALDFRWGTTYGNYDCRIYAATAHIDDVKSSDNNGVGTWDIKGYIEENEIEVWIWNNTASSDSSVSESVSSDSNSSSSSSDSSSSTSTSVSSESSESSSSVSVT